MSIFEKIKNENTMKEHLYLLSLLLVLVSSCGKSKDSNSKDLFEKCNIIATRTVVDGDTLVTCDISGVKQSILLPLSLYTDSLEIIKLDNSEDALVGRANTTVTKNFLGIYDYNNCLYKLFTRKGKFLRKIGAIGQGPGEYKILYDSQIDEDNNRIYLFPWTTKKILVYDLDGNFIQDIPLPRLVHKGCLNVDTDQKQLSVLNLPFLGTPVAWLQDFDGNVISEKMAPHLEFMPDYSHEILNIRYGNSMSFSILYLPPTTDSLYHYSGDKNQLLPVFAATFNEDMPSHYYLETPHFYSVDIIGPSTDPDFTGTVNDRIIIDKETLKGGYYQLVADQLGGISFEKSSYNEYGCILNIDPGILLERIEKRLSTPEKLSSNAKNLLMKLKNTISEDDNNYIIMSKWKESKSL